MIGVLLRAAALGGAALLTQTVFAADIEAGRKKAETCVACHGANGNSTNPIWPSLAGQPAQFISTQLYFYREGNRKDALMSPLAANLSNTDMNDLAAYFSAQKPSTAPARIAAEKAAAGQQVATEFKCNVCHGAALMGVQHIPRLAGQQAEYLRTQLKGFKAQTRFDMDGNMTSATRLLTPEHIDLLADYLASLGTP